MWRKLTFYFVLCFFGSKGQQIIIDNDDHWQYFDKGDIVDSNWSSPNFNSANWAVGQAELGYGDGDESTVVSFGPNSAAKYITTYFRKTVTLPHLSSIECSIKLDDGAVVFFNGIEVFRKGLPAGPITYGTFANQSNENIWETFVIPESMVTETQLTVAVEIHQNSFTSSDLSFNLSLILNKPPPEPKIYINEVLAVNESINEDIDGTNSDWVELRNATSNDVNLNGYFLTDDPSNLTKHEIEDDLVIRKNDYLLLWANGSESSQPVNLNFRLSSSGEFIAIVAPDGISIIDSFSFSLQQADISFGRMPNDVTEMRFFGIPTPSNSNQVNSSYLDLLPDPLWSKDPGFYENDFDLFLNAGEEGATIVYTLDGSVPDIDKLGINTFPYKNSYPILAGQPFGNIFSQEYGSTVYSGPIAISDPTNEPNRGSLIPTTAFFYTPVYVSSSAVQKVTVLRARSYKDGYLPSTIVTGTFIKKPNGEKRYELPLVSINFQPNDFYGYYDGISVPGKLFDDYRRVNPNEPNIYGVNNGNYDLRKEIPGHFEFIKSESIRFSQKAGVRIHGNVSRIFNPQKSIRLYPENSFDFNFFEQTNQIEFERLLLRNSGSDFFNARLRDVIPIQVSKNLNFDYQNYEPVVLYLNGEFSGLINLRERLDDNYIKVKYGISNDEVDIIPKNNTVNHGDSNSYDELISFVNNNSLSEEANYQEFKKRVDIDNLIDYLAIELFFNNKDWPQNNSFRWRKRVQFDPALEAPHDGRWRWSLYDMDYSVVDEPSFNLLSTLLWDNPQFNLLSKLSANPGFVKKFLTRNADLLNTNFKANYVNSKVDEEVQRVEHVMLDHIDRWREPLKRWNSPVDTVFWKEEVSKYKDWISQRGNFYLNHLTSGYILDGRIVINLDVNDESEGSIQLNTLQIREGTPSIGPNAYPWSGEYFKNVENILVALPTTGHKFKHWIINGTIDYSDTLQISSAVDVDITAIFEEQILTSNPIPDSFDIENCFYAFEEWSSDSPGGTFPSNMAFVYMDERDPSENSKIESFTEGAYNLDSKTRISGNDKRGFSFINTGNEDGNVGFPGTKLGGVLLALNTMNSDSIDVFWKGRTMIPNSREYAIKLQYRIGDVQDFMDLLDENGNPINYTRQTNPLDSISFRVSLPTHLMNQEYVQLFWRYYFTGIRNNQNSGARDELGIDDIFVFRNVKARNPLDYSELSGNYSQIILKGDVPSDLESLQLKANKSILIMPGFKKDAGLNFFSASIEESCPND